MTKTHLTHFECPKSLCICFPARISQILTTLKINARISHSFSKWGHKLKEISVICRDRHKDFPVQINIKSLREEVWLTNLCLQQPRSHWNRHIPCRELHLNNGLQLLHRYLSLHPTSLQFHHVQLWGHVHLRASVQCWPKREHNH